MEIIGESNESVFCSTEQILFDDLDSQKYNTLMIIFKISKLNRWSLQTLTLSHEKEIIESWRKILSNKTCLL